MTVYDILWLATDPTMFVVTVFDSNSGAVVYDSRKTEDGECDMDDMEYNGKDLSGYAVDSYDVYADKTDNTGRAVLELNISMGKK